MSREYFVGEYYPFIGYLKENVNVPFDDLKSRYMSGVKEDKRKVREKHFEEWINSLLEDHIISIEYGTVTFYEDQWNRLSGIDK